MFILCFAQSFISFYFLRKIFFQFFTLFVWKEVWAIAYDMMTQFLRKKG